MFSTHGVCLVRRHVGLTRETEYAVDAAVVVLFGVGVVFEVDGFGGEACQTLTSVSRSFFFTWYASASKL